MSATTSHCLPGALVSLATQRRSIYPVFLLVILISLLIGESRAGDFGQLFFPHMMFEARDPQPKLVIETGAHESKVNSVAIDKSCKFVVSGSQDQTVRLWSEGRLAQTWRLPDNDGHSNVLAVAMSFDAQKIAAVGDTGLYLLDVRGRDAKKISTLPSRFAGFRYEFTHLVSGARLTFSSDGNRLAVSVGRVGFRLFDMGSGQEIDSASTKPDKAVDASFFGDGRLITVSKDGSLRLYDQELRLLKSTKTRNAGARASRISAQSSGKYVAVAYEGNTQIEVYSVDDLRFEFSVEANSFDNAVSWSPDGEKLIAAGAYFARGSDKIWRSNLIVWSGAGRGARREQPASLDRVTDIQTCAGGFAFSSVDTKVGFVDWDGVEIWTRSGVAADFAKIENRFLASPDGRKIGFGMKRGSPATFLLLEISHAALRSAKDDDRRDLKPSDLARGSLSLQDGTRRLVAEKGLLQYNEGSKNIWRKEGPADVRSVSLTDDSGLVLAAFGDGTIRWYNKSNGTELLALFVNEENLRWIAWTPSGYFMASPGGEDMIGWRIYWGEQRSPDFYGASRFRDQFSRPDIVQKVLSTLDEAKAVEEADDAAHNRSNRTPLTKSLPPIIKILSPANGSVVQSREIVVQYELRSPSSLPIDTVEVLIDGLRPRGIHRLDSKMDRPRIERQVINIPDKDVQLTVFARSGSLTSEVATIDLKWGGAPNLDKVLKAKLYGVLVGVSNYGLRFAAKDAEDFAEALRFQKGEDEKSLYRDVELKTLTNGKATTEAIKEALAWLERSVTGQDVALVFLAGHGLTDSNQRYRYLAWDSNPSFPERNSLEGAVLIDRLRSIAGKKVVFLDTCYAGQVINAGTSTYINRIVQELADSRNGILAFASSSGNMPSQEDEKWQNGVFTRALIEGLPESGRKGKSPARKGVISAAALNLWLAERVEELTNGRQLPVMQNPDAVPNVPLFVAEKVSMK